MAAQKPKTIRKALTEDIAYQPQAKADRDIAKVKALLDQGIVEDVKILGWESANHRKYLAEGIDPALYAHKPVNLNHPRVENPKDQREMHRAVKSSRDVTGVFGEIREPRKEADGLYGKLWFNTDHSYAAAFRNFVLTAPHLIGLSPAQIGDTYEHGGGEIVERIDDVRSIDLVGAPATTKGLLEGCDDDAMAEDLDQVDDVAGDEDTIPDADEPADDEDTSESSGVDITPEMFASITKIVQGFFDKQIDEKAALTKIKQLLRTHAAIAESIMPDLQVPTTANEAVKILARVAARSKQEAIKASIQKVLLENRQFHEKDAAQSKQLKAKALMEAAGLPNEISTDAAFLEELLDCRDEKRMQAKIEMWRTLFGSRKNKTPRSASQVALTEEERQEAERQLGGGAPAAISDEQRDKRLDDFTRRYTAGSASR